MSDFLNRMFSAINMSFGWPVSMWPISAPLFAVTLWALISLVRHDRLVSKPVMLATGISLVFLIGVAAFAAAFWAEPTYPARPPQLLHAAVLGYIWWAYFLTMALLVGFARGIRMPMAALASTMAWINFGIYFVGVMAVSGNWL
jgi:hypothetical protein